jgi:tRNA(Ile)-lysidine synthase
MALKTPLSRVLQAVLSSLENISGVKRFWVAFSGGIDSHVLLHVLASQRHQLKDIAIQVVHINHALNSKSDQWAEHCGNICEQLKIDFVDIDVDASPRTGESPEARARKVRYEAIAKLIKPEDCLLTAHHQDDQVETLLLQLMRGSGPKGLSAMPEVSVFEEGLIARPLIKVRREEIHAYAVAHKLQWIDDDSNADTKYDRNFIRHEIVPRLQQRWPSLSQTVSRSARNCAEAAEIIEQAADKALQEMNLGESESLSIVALQQFSLVEQRNILRRWLQSRELNTPSSVQLGQIIEQISTAAVDAMPRLTWEGSEVRRYRDQLFAMPQLKDFEMELPIQWSVDKPLVIDDLGVLKVSPGIGAGVAKKFITGDSLTVQFRQGGESIQPVNRKEKHALKKLFQESGVPPWIRERTPLIYIGAELAVVGEMFISHQFQAQEDEDSYIFQWESRLQAGATRGVGL